MLLFQFKEKSPSVNAKVYESNNSTAAFCSFFYYTTGIKYLTKKKSLIAFLYSLITTDSAGIGRQLFW